MVNENFQTEKEEEYKLSSKGQIASHKCAWIAKVSNRKVRILWKPDENDDLTITTLTVILKDGKLQITDFWGWGD